MQKIKGKYAEAVIYSDTAEDYAVAQVQMICDNEAAAGSKIRVMPDVHPGKIGPIGLTMTIGGRIMPGLVGVDIGCGVSYLKIRKTKIEFQQLDRVIREEIPTGSAVRKLSHHMSGEFNFHDLRCAKHINQRKAELSLGTLGGGNHFIELDRDDDGSVFAMVHSGSRSLGREVAEYYLKQGQAVLKARGEDVPYELTYLEGQLMADYLHDVAVVQRYAELNREIMLRVMAKAMKWKVTGSGGSFHNYVGCDGVLRKGAAAAKAGEEVIIPINMRDGIILGVGKGNDDWNCSAPHGAGRIFSRSEVRNHHTVAEYKKAMTGIHCATVGAGTLDEAPFAYRGLDEIVSAIGDTVEITKVIKPIYNFKAKK